jgi:hypothetical protein
MNPIAHWAVAFAVTQIVEVPFYARVLPRGDGLARRLALAFAASAITHPIVWFVVPRLWLGGSYLAMVVASEIFAITVEAAWLGSYGARRPALWSLVANAASVAVGLTLRHTVGWP